MAKLDDDQRRFVTAMFERAGLPVPAPNAVITRKQFVEAIGRTLPPPWTAPGGPGALTGGSATATADRKPAAHPLTVIPIKHASAPDLVDVLRTTFRNAAMDLSFDSRTNSLIIRADDATLAEVKKLLEKLDVDVGDPKPVPKKR
jgi:hypothetical protein